MTYMYLFWFDCYVPLLIEKNCKFVISAHNFSILAKHFELKKLLLYSFPLQTESYCL